ncbi:MAG: hypothetical protein FWG34_06200 [Oscillospiraceae bacterium]|nr:hypothetical protein [Oscillospiraceae bacterium]
MVTKMTLAHFLNKEAFETIRERLIKPSKNEKNKNLTYTSCCEPITEISLRETDKTKPVHAYVMQVTLDCTKKEAETDFWDWVAALYQEKFSIKNIKDFPEYEKFVCDYAEYEMRLPVDNPDKALAKITSKGRWLPEQLDKEMWDSHKQKFGQYNFYFSKDGKSNFLVRACCDGSLLKKKCADPGKIRANGVDPDYVLDPETEELYMSAWKVRAMSANRVNKAVYAPEEIKKVLANGYRTVASEFIDLAKKRELKPDVQYTPAKKAWKCAYSDKKAKRVIFTVFASPGELKIKANLFAIDKYLKNHNLSGAIKSQLLNNCWNCGECTGNNCRRGVKFSMDGQSHYKCIGGAFTFINLEIADFRKIIELTESELNEAR